MAALSRDCVCVFLRLPHPGRVKTRLAAAVGNAQAALFYRCCAETVVGQLGRLTDVAIHVCYSRAEDEVQVAAWLRPVWAASMRLVPQLEHPDLGARMQHATAYAFDCGHRRVVVVGSDVPDLRCSSVARALHALECYQVVFGPAQDGGYYLLALDAPIPAGLFQGIEWSTPSVLADSLNSAQRLGLRVAPLDTIDTLPDIDTIQDLERWCSSCRERERQRHDQPRESQQQPDVQYARMVDVATSIVDSVEWRSQALAP